MYRHRIRMYQIRIGITKGHCIRMYQIRIEISDHQRIRPIPIEPHRS